jgi:hypothetical protein
LLKPCHGEPRLEQPRYCHCGSPPRSSPLWRFAGGVLEVT